MDGKITEKALQVASNLTVSQQARSGLPTTLQGISGSLAPEEQAILAVKYRLPRISEIKAIDIPRHAKGLLFRLHTITGWKLPDDEYFLNTLVSEFTQYLVERCGDLNPEEISFAFRNYALDVKDWGKSMNLSLIDSPLSEYRQRRRAVSELEESRRRDDKEEELPPGECDWSEQWAAIKEAAKKGQLQHTIILSSIYDWLERNGHMNLEKDDKVELMKSCREDLILELQSGIAEGTGNRRLLDQVKSDEWMKAPDVKARLVNMSKVKAVKELAISESI